MPVSLAHLSNQSLNKIQTLGRYKMEADNALVVPYGKGKFYLATRQSRVAAFLPTFLNRLLKLTVHDGHEKAGRAYEIFKRSLEKSRGEAGSSVFQKRSIQTGKVVGDGKLRGFKLTLGYAAKIIDSVDEEDPPAKNQPLEEAKQAMKKVAGEVYIEARIRAEAARYLPDLRELRGKHVDDPDEDLYEGMLKKVFPAGGMEQITEGQRLLYEFRFLKMLVTAYRANLWLTLEGGSLNRGKAVKSVETIAMLAAYRTFKPDAEIRRKLEKRLTQVKPETDSDFVEAWRKTVEVGNSVTELPKSDTTDRVSPQSTRQPETIGWNEDF